MESYKKALEWLALELGGKHLKREMGSEPRFSVLEEHTQVRKTFLRSCLIRSFSKWVGSPEAVRKWVVEVWDVEDGLRISQLGDTRFLFQFANVKATKVLQRGRSWLGGNFLRVEIWDEKVGCVVFRPLQEDWGLMLGIY